MDTRGQVVLQPKEAAAFKKLVKCWEEKQWKVGLRLAKQILGCRGCGDHGETVSMRGLILLGLGRRVEAMEEVKRGLKNNLKSPLCWHAFGLLNRAERRFEEAIKSFRQSLRLEPDNITVLRDLSVLQVHTRDLDGYLQSRQAIFQCKPSQRGSWSGLAIGHHLTGDLPMAVLVMEQFRKSQQDVNRDMVGHIMKQMFNRKNDYDYEFGELLLYQNQVLRESGDLEAALDHLDQWGQGILDRVKREEIRVELCLGLGRRNQAIPVCEQLIKRNPECSKYYKQLVDARECQSREDTVSVLRQCLSLYPGSRTVRVLIMEQLQGELFQEELLLYLKEGIKKGVPSLLQTLPALYQDPDKIAVVTRVLTHFQECLRDGLGFEGEDGKTKELPDCLVWTYHLLTEHHDRLGQWDDALHYSDLALTHTPTLVELYIARARIHKHRGENMLAAQWMEEAHGLDTADKAVACRTAKYMVRAARMEEALGMMGLFTKPGEGVLDYLVETQCSWFLLEMAKAYLAKGETGQALVQCHYIKDIFQQVEEDQLDFHLFSMSRMRLCHYVDLLRFEDRLRTFGFYEPAAQLAISIYVDMFDRTKEEQVKTVSQESELSLSEQKKQRNKAKKALKKEQEAKGKVKEKARSEKVEAECLTPKKTVYSALELETTSSPLECAMEFLRPLQCVLGDKLDTQLAAFQVARRRGKPLLMLQAAKRAGSLEPKSERVTHMWETLQKWQQLGEGGQGVHEVVMGLVQEGCKEWFHGIVAH